MNSKRSSINGVSAAVAAVGGDRHPLCFAGCREAEVGVTHDRVGSRMTHLDAAKGDAVLVATGRRITASTSGRDIRRKQQQKREAQRACHRHASADRR